MSTECAIQSWIQLLECSKVNQFNICVFFDSKILQFQDANFTRQRITVQNQISSIEQLIVIGGIKWMFSTKQEMLNAKSVQWSWSEKGRWLCLL